jgi:hypothetical protein
MSSFFTRAILAYEPTIFAYPTRSFSHFRHDANLGALAFPLILGGKSDIPIVILVVKDDNRSALFP